MKLFLKVLAIIFCCAGNQAQRAAGFEVGSVYCDQLNDDAHPPLCVNTEQLFYNEICRYWCNEYGILNTNMCGYQFALVKDYHRCQELYCIGANHTQELFTTNATGATVATDAQS